MFNRKNFIEESLTESSKTKLEVLRMCSDDISKTADIFINALKKGYKLMFCGNGGSAADSQHIATEFVVRLSHDIKRPPIAAIALSTDSSNLTAGGNDIGFENIFSRNVEAIGKPGDVLIGISTSGNSMNIINAFKKASELEITKVAFLGGNGGKLITDAECSICVPSSNVQRIQESHITIGHILVEIVERELYTK
jgi:D-sedoheptulose 7-phosphate isomerase